jgi:hypothetical protein
VKTPSPGEEDAAPGDEVAQPAGEQQQPAEGDQVGVDDPREARLREPKVVLDRGEGHVHDRGVEDDHEHPHAEDIQRCPSPAVLSSLNGHVLDLLGFRVRG